MRPSRSHADHGFLKAKPPARGFAKGAKGPKGHPGSGAGPHKPAKPAKAPARAARLRHGDHEAIAAAKAYGDFHGRLSGWRAAAHDWVVLADSNEAQTDLISEDSLVNHVANDLSVAQRVAIQIEGGITKRVESELKFLCHAQINPRGLRSIPD